MGQYYHPCIITQKRGITKVVAWLNAHKYGSGLKQMEHSYVGNRFVSAFEWLISPEGPHHKTQVVWAGDDFGPIEDGSEKSVYELCDEKLHANPQGNDDKYPFVVNHTLKLYIKKPKIVGKNCPIHPLPLLTRYTCMSSGGDYRGIHENYLGRWAGDVMSVEETVPEGFKNLQIRFRREMVKGGIYFYSNGTRGEPKAK